jgi:hypothetical protein
MYPCGLAKRKAALASLDRPSLSLTENPVYNPSKNEPFSQEVHLKIPLLSPGFEIGKF